MKREGNIATVEAIERSIKQYKKYELLRNGGSEHKYDAMGFNGKSDKFSRKYRVFCSRYQVLKGFIDILLVFDYRTDEGRIVIKNELAPLFCKVIPHTGKHLWSLKRYFSCEAKNKTQGGR